MRCASPVSFFFSAAFVTFFSLIVSGFFAVAAFVWQSGKQSDRRGTGADQETPALELDHGNEAAVAEGGGFADRKLLAPAAYVYARGQRSPNHGAPESSEAGSGQRKEARPVRRRVARNVDAGEFHLGQLRQ